MAPLHVGLLYGGQSSEHDISILSARGVSGALDRSRYRVTPLFIAPDGRWFVEADGASRLDGSAGSASAGEAAWIAPGSGDVARADLIGLGLDVVIPMLHGQNGEDGRIQGLLDTLGIAYVGPGVLASAACMDKEVTKRLLRDAGIPVVPFAVVRRGEAPPAYADLAEGLGRVLFVKPCNSGSSVGVSRVESEVDLAAALDAAFRYDHKLLVEQAMAAREIEVAVLGNETPRTSVPGEIVSTATFYDYEAKYLDAEAARMQVPADLPPDVTERVRQMAADAYRTLGCEGLSRVDFFVTDAGDVAVNEINTIPGFTTRSMYPVMFAESGLPLHALLDTLIDLGIERHRRDAALSHHR